MINRCTGNFNDIAIELASYGCKDILIDIINMGASDFDEIYKTAKETHNNEISHR